MDIVIYIYNGLTALDAVGAYEVLSRLPKANVKFVGEQKGVIVSDTHFLKLFAEYDIASIDRADILVVPGSTVGFIREIKKPAVLAWMAKIHETTSWTTSVCTGSIILAAAGVLDGLEATSHWAAIHLLKDYDVQPKLERFVQQGKVITAQGVSAGIDMSLHLVSQIVGEDKARAYQLAIEYFPAPPLGIQEIDQVDEPTRKLAQKIMAADARKDLSIMEIVRNAQKLLKLQRGK